MYKGAVLEISTAFVIVILNALLFWPQLALAKVNINIADSAELQTLTGIGEVKAKAIIDYRSQNGDFTDIVQIKNVSGIGDATYNNIKNDITVGDSVVSGEDFTSDESPYDTSAGGEDKEEAKIEVSGLTMKMPQVGYVNQLINFDVDPEKGTKDRLVRYRWSFGDTNVANQKSPMHSYDYPGTYVVVVESYYNKKELMARQEIIILPIQLSLSRLMNGDVEIKNESSKEIDLGGMKLVGQKVFTFPDHTILLSGKSLIVLHDDIDSNPGSTVTLHNEFGGLIGSTYLESEINTEQAIFYTTESQNRQSVISKTETSSTTNTASMVASSSIGRQDAAVGSSGTNSFPIASNKLPYLGLIGIISAGLFSVYISKLRS